MVQSNLNKEERYSPVPRLSDTLYSAKGTKGNGDMQAAKWDWNAPPAPDLNIDLSVMGVRVGVGVDR